jgi:signal transduction histidine kinase
VGRGSPARRRRRLPALAQADASFLIFQPPLTSNTGLFRIAQEALHNIEKHAQATEAQLELLEQDGNICLEISDNGRSFHPDHAHEARKNGRLGLASMRERAEMLGGTLEIKADPGNGTIVKAAVPVNGNHKPHEQKT